MLAPRRSSLIEHPHRLTITHRHRRAQSSTPLPLPSALRSARAIATGGRDSGGGGLADSTAATVTGAFVILTGTSQKSFAILPMLDIANRDGRLERQEPIFHHQESFNDLP